MTLLTKLPGRGETSPMVSIIVHFLLGLACIAGIIASNPKIFAKPAGGPWLSPFEIVYSIAGIGSIVLGYWFNIPFVMGAPAQGNPLSWPDSETTFIRE